MIPSAKEQMNKDITNMGTKSSSIQITSAKLRMNSNEHESEQLSDEIESYYPSHLDCTNNATIMVSSSSSTSSYIAVKKPRDKEEEEVIKQSEEENFQEPDENELNQNDKKRDVFFSDTSFIDKINLIEEHHQELKFKETYNDSLTELTLIDQEANKHNELEAQFLDKIQEVRSVESPRIKTEMQALNIDEKQNDQEMSPASPIISLELPSTNFLEAFNGALSDSKLSTDANKQSNENDMETSSLHFSFDSINEKKQSESIVVDVMMESDREVLNKDMRDGTRELFEKRVVENPSEMLKSKQGLFDKSVHQAEEPQAVVNREQERVVKFKEVIIVKTYNLEIKSIFKEEYDANNKLIKSELQDRSKRKELLTENKITKFHSTCSPSTSTSLNTIPSSITQMNFVPPMQQNPHGTINKSISLLEHEFASNGHGNVNELKQNGTESPTKRNAEQVDDESERKNETKDEKTNAQSKTSKLMRTNFKNKPKIKLGIRVNKDVTSSSEEEEDDVIYDQRTGQWIKRPSTTSRSSQHKSSSSIVTRSSKNSPLFAPKQRQEKQSNKRTRFNSPSFNHKAQPESKKQRNRVTSSQYFSFSDIKFKLTPEERRIEALKSKEAQKEEEQKRTDASKPDSRNSTNIVDQTNAKSKEAVGVDAVSSKTHLAEAKELDSQPASVESNVNAIDRFMQEFSNNVANYMNLIDLEEKNDETNSQIVLTNNFPTASAQQHTGERFKLKELTVRLDRLDENVFQKYMNKYKEYKKQQAKSASKEHVFDYQVGDRVFVLHNEDYWLPAIVQNKMSANLKNQTLVLHQCKFLNTSVEKPRVNASSEAFTTSQLIPYDLLQASDALLVYDQKTKLYKSATLEEYESVQNEKLDESVLSYVVLLNSTKSKQTSPFQDIKLENKEVKKMLARVASNQPGTNKTEESHNFHLNHDHQYTSVKLNEQQQDEAEMTGDDNNSIITLSSTHSSTSDLITRRAAKNALKTLRTKNVKISLPIKMITPNKNDTKQSSARKK